MDFWSLCLNGALFLCAGTAFVFGVVKFFKKRVALFNQLIVCGLGCMMLGRLFNTITLLTNNTIPIGFSVGQLGFFGCFMFLFSASFGQMNGLVDGGGKEFRKYRILALLAPLCIAGAYMIVLFCKSEFEGKVITGIIMIILAQCSYYNLKHLIIPDVDMGIIRSIRGYNLTALIIATLSTAELVAQSLGGRIAETVITVLLCVSYVVVIPVLEKGVTKWTM